MKFSEKIKEYLGFDAWSNLQKIDLDWELVYYVEICDYAVARIDVWDIEIYHSGDADKSIWFYKDFIYFLQNFKEAFPDFEFNENIRSDSTLFGSYHSTEDNSIENIFVCRI